jgi:hypothetical protein
MRSGHEQGGGFVERCTNQQNFAALFEFAAMGVALIGEILPVAGETLPTNCLGMSCLSGLAANEPQEGEKIA